MFDDLTEGTSDSGLLNSFEDGLFGDDEDDFDLGGDIETNSAGEGSGFEDIERMLQSNFDEDEE